MARSKYTLLIPLNYNDGSIVPQDELEGILDRIYVLASGYTIAGEVTGAFRLQNGTKQVDRLTQVWIVLDDADVPKLRQLIAEIGRELKQEMMYLERSEGAVEFIKPFPEGEPP
jgi:hypothetical protein